MLYSDPNVFSQNRQDQTDRPFLIDDDGHRDPRAGDHLERGTARRGPLVAAGRLLIGNQSRVHLELRGCVPMQFGARDGFEDGVRHTVRSHREIADHPDRAFHEAVLLALHRGGEILPRPSPRRDPLAGRAERTEDDRLKHRRGRLEPGERLAGPHAVAEVLAHLDDPAVGVGDNLVVVFTAFVVASSSKRAASTFTFR